MIKSIFFCLVLILLFNKFSFAQDTSLHAPDRIIEIIDGQSLREKTIDSLTKIETISGNALLKEGATKFYCDSAIINRRLNTIEAFGNVHINDSDTLNTYSQYLKYYGNDRLAYLKKDVKLTDSKGTLLTQELEYDLKSGIGKYHNGGKVVNGQTVLTSVEGIYYADTKDVYFKNNVYLKDPNNTTTADSLLYNTQTQVITLIGPTHSKSKDADIYSSQGTYDLKSGNSTFGSRSLIKDSSGRTYQANNIALDDKSGLAQLEGNAIIRDSANGVVVTGNQIFLNKKNNSFLATRKPVLIIQREKDSTYIAADTLFSGFTTKVNAQKDSIRKDTSITDTLVLHQNKNDSINTISQKTDSINIISKQTDSIKLKETQAFIHKRDHIKNDSLRNNLLRKDSLKTILVQNDSLKIDSQKTISIIEPLKKDSMKIDSVAQQTGHRDSITAILSTMDSLGNTKPVSLNKKDSAIRYFLAFHHVKMFNDSLQSVCDSLFYSAEDSTFRLFYDPIVWNGQSQLTGDTIYLFTKNKKTERIYAFENAMVINKSRRDFYNQIAGKTLNGYFKDGVIDYTRVKGSPAESVYYVQDKDSAYIGMNRASSDVIDMYFIKQELDKVKFVNEVNGTLHPMRKIPEDQKFLKNFEWQDKRRPKNKLELFE